MAQYFWPIMPVILEHEHYGGSVQRKAWDKNLLLKNSMNSKNHLLRKKK
jgi:hypothetical protein